MDVLPHLLYPDVRVHRPNIRIRLYHDDALAAVYGADFLTKEEIETGVLHRACLHATVSMVDGETLRRYRAAVEGNGVELDVHYDPAELEFFIKKPE